MDHWCLSIPSSRKCETVKPKKRPKDGSNELIVLLAMEKEFHGKQPTMAELYDVVAEAIICPRKSYRKEYVRRAVKKLAVSDSPWLFEHGECVSLLSAPQGDDFGAWRTVTKSS